MAIGRQERGRDGEEIAAEYLRQNGYRILARNYRCPVGELDLVAEQGDSVVFVEVRTRRAGCMVRPEDTVNRTKMRHVVRSAEHFLSSTAREDRPWRVDVVALEVDHAGRPVRVEHYQDALADVARGQ